MKGYVVATLLVFTAAGLVGCATTTPVVPIGNGHYEISGKSATAWASEGDEKVRVIQSANDYCGKMGKQAVVESASGKDGKNGNLFVPAQAANADVVFSCQ